jgi:hypothetical protein
MQDFIVYYWIYLKAAEASIAYYEEDENEST